MELAEEEECSAASAGWELSIPTEGLSTGSGIFQEIKKCLNTATIEELHRMYRDSPEGKEQRCRFNGVFGAAIKKIRELSEKPAFALCSFQFRADVFSNSVTILSKVYKENSGPPHEPSNERFMFYDIPTYPVLRLPGSTIIAICPTSPSDSLAVSI